MEHDDGEDGEGVIVPLSLIKALSENMLTTIDQWHEERNIHCLDMGQCVVAMIAAIDAVTETINQYPDGSTLQ
jgi:hypothetical protein